MWEAACSVGESAGLDVISNPNPTFLPGSCAFRVKMLNGPLTEKAKILFLNEW